MSIVNDRGCINTHDSLISCTMVLDCSSGMDHTNENTGKYRPLWNSRDWISHKPQLIFKCSKLFTDNDLMTPLGGLCRGRSFWKSLVHRFVVELNGNFQDGDDEPWTRSIPLYVWTWICGQHACQMECKVKLCWSYASILKWSLSYRIPVLIFEPTCAHARWALMRHLASVRLSD